MGKEQSKELRGFVAEAGEQLLDRWDFVEPIDIAKQVRSNHPEELGLIMEILAEQQLLRLSKTWLSNSTAAEAKTSPQLLLTGDPAPLTLTIKGNKPGTFKYIRIDKANDKHNQEYEEILEEHINGAIAKRQDWREKRAQLRPAYDSGEVSNNAEAVEWLKQKEKR